MRKLILASHGSMAEGLMSAAAMILGDAEQMSAYGLDTWVSPKNILEEIRRQILREPDEEYVLLCDMKGGSVHNCLMELFSQFEIQIFTGMNLTLVLELAVLGDEILSDQETNRILEDSRNNISFFNERVLKKIKEEEGEDSLW